MTLNIASIVLASSKKGIAITAAIAVAIVGSSFLIWYLPSQRNVSSMTRLPGDYGGILSDVYSSHSTLANQVDSEFASWKDGNVTSEEMSADIDYARGQIDNMVKQLNGANPTAEWQQSYSNYTKSLESFDQYLQAMEQRVKTDDKTGSDSEMNSLKQESNDYVDKSIQSFPIGQ